MKKIIMFLIIMFLFNINVSAASLCTYKEQTDFNSKAANVKATYEIVEDKVKAEWIEGEIEEILIGYHFNIMITNVTEELYVIVKNNVNDDEQIFTNDDIENGVISFSWENVEEITNFTIQVYTSAKTKCPNERYKTIYLTTPRFNDFSERTICMDYTDFYLCQKFVTFAEIDDTKFVNELNKYEEKIDKTNENNDRNDVKDDNENNFFEEYKWYLISGIILIVCGLFVVYITNKKKRQKQRELGL